MSDVLDFDSLAQPGCDLGVLKRRCQALQAVVGQECPTHMANVLEFLLHPLS